MDEADRSCRSTAVTRATYDVYCDQNDNVKEVQRSHSCYFNSQQAYYDCK